MDRRKYLKLIVTGAVAVAAVIAGCKTDDKKTDNKIAGIAKPQASKINAITAIDTLKIAKKSFKVSPKFLFLTL